MKKQILSIVLTMFMGIAFASAKELKPKKSYANASQQINQLLTPSSEVGELEKAVIVRVKIKINSNNQIVVLETNAPTADLNNYIISNLNYKVLTSAELEIDNEYVFVVNFKS